MENRISGIPAQEAAELYQHLRQHGFGMELLHKTPEELDAMVRASMKQEQERQTAMAAAAQPAYEEKRHADTP